MNSACVKKEETALTKEEPREEATVKMEELKVDQHKLGGARCEAKGRGGGEGGANGGAAGHPIGCQRP